MLKEDGNNLEMNKIKSLIIGCGKIAGLYEDDKSPYIYSHSRAITMNNDYDLISCCDVDLVKAKRLATKYNIPNYSDDFLKQIEENKIDVVSVCSSDDTHFVITKNILENKFVPKVIFLEKPACNKIEEFDELLDLSKKRNVLIIVNHSRRFDDNHIIIKQLISEKFFGKLFRIDIYYYSGWEHNGIHIIDTLNFLFNDELEIKNIFSIQKSPYFGDYTADFELRFKNNRGIVYLNGIDENFYQLFEFDMKFDKSRLRIEDFGKRIIFEKKIINEMKENVLITGKLKLKKEESSPMQNAYKYIKEYLFNNNEEVKEYSLENIYKTMSLIWEGKQWIKKLI